MRLSSWTCLAAAAVASSSPAFANKLMPAGQPQTVAKSNLTVTPGADWNKLSARTGRNAESWTLDGLTLNALTFYGGIQNGATLFRDARKNTDPLPRFSSTMLIPDIVQLFESSYRVSVGTSLMTIDTVEPATFAGRPGFHFTYSFVVQDEEVRRKGEANGAVIDGKLYLITFEAPVIHYFGTDIAAYRAVAASVRLGPTQKP